MKALLLTVLFFVNFSFAQVTPEQYNKEKENLLKQKILLTEQIKQLRTEIDSLNKTLPELDEKIRSAYRELYVLKYGRKIGNDISQKKIWKGMTEAMLKDSWGKPDRITKNVEKWGVFTQWYYGSITFFFRDHKLTDWEEKK